MKTAQKKHGGTPAVVDGISGYWLTMNGQPVFIDEEGMIRAGMGGKFNGKKLDEMTDKDWKQGGEAKEGEKAEEEWRHYDQSRVLLRPGDYGAMSEISKAAEGANSNVEQWAERSSNTSQKRGYNIAGRIYEVDHELSILDLVELVVMDDFKRRWGFTKAAAHGVVSGVQEVINTLYDVENALSEYLPDWMRYGLTWETVDVEVRFSFGKAEGQLTAPQRPNVAAPEATEGKLISDISRIMFGLFSAGKVLKGMKIAESFGAGFKAMLQGGIVDFAFTPANSSFFASPDDTPMEGRLKNLAEGIVIGKMVDKLMRNLGKSLDEFLKAWVTTRKPWRYWTKR